MGTISLKNGTSVNRINSSFIEKVDWNQGDGLKRVSDSSYVNILNANNLQFAYNNPCSFSFIFVPTLNYNDSQIIFSLGSFLGGYSIGYLTSNKISLQFNANTTNRYYIICDYIFQSSSIFHCVINKYDSNANNADIYINGVRYSYSILYNSLSSITYTSNIGKIGKYVAPNDITLLYKMSLINYDLKIYNRVLTQSEITKLYNTMNQIRPDNGLMLDYRMDEKVGTVLKDYSSNGYNGTLTNFDTTSNLGGGAWVNQYGNTITQY